MAKDFPESVSYTKPEGGMFIWATMPEGLKAVDVMQAAAAKGVPSAPATRSMRRSAACAPCASTTPTAPTRP